MPLLARLRSSRLALLAEKPVKAVIRRRLLAGRFRSDDFDISAPGAGRPRGVAVLMCLWNRPGHFRTMLELLDAQTGTPPIDLYLWNNNKVEHDLYLEELAFYRPSGALRSVRIVRSPYNLGSIARFYWARALAKKREQPIIVIDDDEVIEPTFVQTALEVHEPGAVHAWWAFTVASDDYFDRTPAVVGGPVDHVGPGGMVCSSAIFLDDEFFTALPQRYWMLDDLWFTWFATSRGYTLKKLPVEIEFVLSDTNQHWSLGDLKREFFRYLSVRTSTR
ncbi:glycosyltransferase family 2 protein [Herbiconiux liukaitaii]|uniref:glycosyltransferase family 2 protein n=1 Tax=Herbiconiux liukaitaii TaxID=3342799 RepID=UPI0035BB5BA5